MHLTRVVGPLGRRSRRGTSRGAYAAPSEAQQAAAALRENIVHLARAALARGRGRHSGFGPER